MTLRRMTTRRSFLSNTLRGGAAVAAASCGLASRAASRRGDGAYHVGIYTRPWDQYDYRVALDAIVEAGYRHVGLMTTKRPSGGRLVISVDTAPEEAERVGEEVKKRGLSVCSIYGGSIPIHRSLEQGIAGLRRLIDNCVAVRAKSLLMGGIGRADLYDRYYQAIAECCDYAAERGLPITVKPHGGLNSTGPQCRKCIERVGHKNFSLWYDPGNIFFYSHGELDPVDDAATVAGLVTEGICIKDFDMTVKNGKPTRDVWITPGTGRVDFPKVLKVLRDGGFRSGHWVIECVARGDGSLRRILAEAKEARQYVEHVISGLAVRS